MWQRFAMALFSENPLKEVSSRTCLHPWTEHDLAGPSDDRKATQPYYVWMGELLLSWTSQYAAMRLRLWLRTKHMMSKLKLTVNDSKMRLCTLPEEKFDFLGQRLVNATAPKLDEPISAPFQRESQFVQPPFHTVVFDVLECLIVHSLCSAIGFASFVGTYQNVLPVYLVMQRVETKVGRFLRLCV